MLPWTRRYVAKLAAQQAAPLEGLWDEAIAALLRADVHFSAAVGTRLLALCSSLVIAATARIGHQLDIDEAELVTPSAEDEAIAREGVRDFTGPNHNADRTARA